MGGILRHLFDNLASGVGSQDDLLNERVTGSHSSPGKKGGLRVPVCTLHAMALSYSFLQMYGDHAIVEPTQLTPPAAKVEEALRDFKDGVGSKAPDYASGHIDQCPNVRILASKEEGPNYDFRQPYDCVEELYELAEQSQVGTATETLYRLDARKSKEFSRIEVLSESWNDKVTSVCEEIRQKLAPGASKVTAHLYKLLLYSEGDFFHQHQDAQHSTHMFGTLLFFLPIDHEGGDFCLYERGSFRNSSSQQFKAPKSSKGCTWVSFYTDVRHRVDKITKGHRVVLNYSLCFEGSMSPLPVFPSFSPDAASVITSCLSSARKVLAVPLTYNYTLATLSPDFLKGIDAYLYAAINQIASIDLQFVMGLDKTKVIFGYEDGWDFDHSHSQLFQGVSAVPLEIAKIFFDVFHVSEQQMNKLKEKNGEEEEREKWKKISAIRNSTEAVYESLMKMVRTTQEDLDMEWIVRRNKEGNAAEFAHSYISFSSGKLSWLGNMSPAKEYYYLRAAMLIKGKQE